MPGSPGCSRMSKRFFTFNAYNPVRPSGWAVPAMSVQQIVVYLQIVARIKSLPMISSPVPIFSVRWQCHLTTVGFSDRAKVRDEGAYDHGGRRQWHSDNKMNTT